MQQANKRLIAVLGVINSPNRIHPMAANTITPMENPKILLSQSEPLKAVMKLPTLCI